MANLVAYYRVSTKRQGDSGLGLEGQAAAVEAHARQSGASVVKAFTEVESGRLSDRPELAKALAHCRRSKGTLIVAKLDRLARNVAFLSRLMESGVEFIACDNPHANRLTIQILAAVAEAEAKAISDRTKAALAAFKARGGRLGSAREGHWQGREDRRRQGGLKGAKQAAVARSREADEAYADLLPAIQARRANGEHLSVIAAGLNNEGYTTRTGRPFTPTTVLRILRRHERGNPTAPKG
jgi:DNA invertase Pin-like site-specific DNA recombinase